MGDTFFHISVESLNLFSMVLGVIFGLSTGIFNRFYQWWLVVGYFAAVAFYFYIQSGALK
jgi:hypothetical protein